MAVHYEVRVRACGAERLADHFGDLDVRTDGTVLLLQGDLDQAALHGVLERVRLLRLDLLDVRRSRSTPSQPS